MGAMGLSGDELVQCVLAKGGDAAFMFGPDALRDETALKRAYKLMALRLHPDKNSHANAHEAFQVMQHAFEMTLESLRTAKGTAAPPSAKTATKSSAPTRKTEEKSEKRAEKKNGQPPPPPWWGQRGPGNETKSTSGSAGWQERQTASATADFSDIPLPPDLFGEFPTAESAPSRQRQRPNPPPPPPPMRSTKPLPGLDISSSDDDRSAENSLGGKEGTSSPRTGGSTWAGKHKKPSPAGVQHQAKCGTGYKSLRQIFEELDISGDDDDVEVSLEHTSVSGVDRVGTPHPNSWSQQQQQHPSHQRAPGTKRGAAASSNSSANSKALSMVACPFCSRGQFSVQLLSVVLCPSCGSRFVPAGVSMMNSKTSAMSDKKGSSSQMMCSCGKTKKGLCFLCE
uniref:J domain-containing protein n=1 Tax=Trypanosoma vivax (strain Y486) TaxID=1055687 RepID=G0UCC1_TRYVY|nr:conserved hypothetical protein [Trypanosoma vivax Y486]